MERSAHSDIVFLPFRFRRNQIVSLFGHPASELLRWLPATILIQAAEDIDLDAEPETGEAAERAEIIDALEEARKKAERALKEAEEAAKRAEKAQSKLAELQTSEIPDQDNALSRTRKEAEDAQHEAEKTARKAAKAVAKMEMAEKEVSEIEGLHPKPEQKQD